MKAVASFTNEPLTVTTQTSTGCIPFPHHPLPMSPPNEGEGREEIGKKKNLQIKLFDLCHRALVFRG